MRSVPVQEFESRLQPAYTRRHGPIAFSGARPTDGMSSFARHLLLGVPAYCGHERLGALVPLLLGQVRRGDMLLHMEFDEFIDQAIHSAPDCGGEV